MALQNKLKAFVRFDGLGRVIPSSLILQKSKPKVGNWKEINAKECCNYTPGTTTTTTTGGSGFTFNVNLGYSEQSACAGVPAWNLYAATPFLNSGTTLYYDAQLNLPYDGVYGSYIQYQNVVYTSSGSTITNNGTACTSITTTTTTTGVPVWQVFTFGAYNELDACAGSTSNPLFYASPDGSLGNGTALYYDSELINPYSPSGNGTYLKMYFGAADQVCTMSGNIIQSYTAC